MTLEEFKLIPILTIFGSGHGMNGRDEIRWITFKNNKGWTFRYADLPMTSFWDFKTKSKLWRDWENQENTKIHLSGKKMNILSRVQRITNYSDEIMKLYN